MATKRVQLPEVGLVTLYKRRGNRSIRLSIAHDGTVRVSLPSWAPYRAGIEFARSKSAWLAGQQTSQRQILIEGQAVGKAHHLHFLVGSHSANPHSRLNDNEINITIPAGLSIDSEVVQKVAKKASIRALRSEAKQLLPQRLKALATMHDFTYSELSLRQLKSRWGSCDSDRHIKLSIFLMQLPWQLIDYVILHELVHTKVLRHGPDFWDLLIKHSPDAKQLRRDIRRYKPSF